MNRDTTILVLIAIALWLLSRRRPAVHATIYGATVAEGVDVTEGGSIPGPDYSDLDDDWLE